MSKSKVLTQTVVRPAPSHLVKNLLTPPGRAEGHAVPVQALGTTKDGEGIFGIDVSKAPIPQRRYAAELCSVTFDDFEVKFIFAQRCLVEDSLDSALVIRMNPHALGEFSQSLHGRRILPCLS